MDKDLSFYKALIEKNAYRFTRQKECILKILIKSEKHLNVKEIYEQVKDKHIGLATVYRNLKVFEELGIVKEINVGGKGYYEIKIFSKSPLHIHFKCYKCNRIMDIDDKKIDLEYVKLNRRVEENKNVEIYDANIMLIGLCNKCREDTKCQDQPNLGA